MASGGRLCVQISCSASCVISSTYCSAKLWSGCAAASAALPWSFTRSNSTPNSWGGVLHKEANYQKGSFN
eukprot:593323-Pyramimonas_sp.AAC.1